MSDLDLNEARQRFQHCPIGVWESYLGGGHDNLIGVRLTFCPDGSGIMEEWGFDHEHVDPTYLKEPSFLWKTLGEQRLIISWRDQCSEVSYDFRTCRNEYGIKELRMYEPTLPQSASGDVGFWISPFSLVYREPLMDPPKLGEVIRRLWKKLG